MSAVAAITRSWKVGRYTATLSMPPFVAGEPVHLVIDWAPCKPPSLNAEEWCEYRAGRNAAIAEIAQGLGIGAAVIDL